MEGMLSRRRNLWFYGYVPYKMGFGLLSVLVPLFLVENLGGTVLDVGIITAMFNLVTIPSVIFWGYLSDKVDKRKIFIFASFLLTGISVVLLAFTGNVIQFLILNVVQAVFFTMHEPATNMLIVELNDKEEWNDKIGLYQMIAGIAWALGLVLGAVSVTAYGFHRLILISAGLCFLTFILSMLLIQDPKVSFKREIITVRLIGGACVPERAMFRYRWIHRPPHLKGLILKFFDKTHSSLGFLNLGVLMFSLSATMFFTPLAIFFLQKMSLDPTMIFLMFFLNSIVCALSYPLAGNLAKKYGDKKIIQVATGSRIITFPLFATCLILPMSFATVTAFVLLAVVGTSWALFAVSSMELSMELSPASKTGEGTGIYYASTGVGSVIGGLLGGVLPSMLWGSQYGLPIFFVVCGLIFAVTLPFFRKI